MKAPIREGDTFTWSQGTIVTVYRREADDPTPIFNCERIRITVLSRSDDPRVEAAKHTFGTEPEWFRQRGLEAAPPTRRKKTVAR